MHLRQSRCARLSHAASELGAGDPTYNYDFIALQEVFTEESRVPIEAAAKRGGLPYVRHFISGSNIPLGSKGSGCSVLSAHPIISTNFHRFTVNGCAPPRCRIPDPKRCGTGFPENIHHWDFQADKVT